MLATGGGRGPRLPRTMPKKRCCIEVKSLRASWSSSAATTFTATIACGLGCASLGW
jgi:hypothetical protein